MTTPAEPPREHPESPRVPEPSAAPEPPRDPAPSAEPSPQLDPNDPYRFGLPDTPPPPEYAPPGWTPPGGWPPAPAPPYPGAPWQQPGASPYHGYPPPYQGSSAPYPGSSPGQAHHPGQGHHPGQSPYPPYPGPPQGRAPYPPYPYPPTGHSAQQQARTHRRSVAALVLGILSIPFAFAGFLDVVFVISATAFGVLALGDRPPDGAGRRDSSRRLAVAGLVCATVGALAAIVWTVYVVHLVNNCGGFNQPNTGTLRSCLQRQL